MELDVGAPVGTSIAEVERYVYRVAAEFGAAVTERKVITEAPPTVRWSLRTSGSGTGTLFVTAAPARVFVTARDDAAGTWAGPRAGLIAERLGTLVRS